MKKLLLQHEKSTCKGGLTSGFTVFATVALKAIHQINHSYNLFLEQ